MKQQKELEKTKGRFNMVYSILVGFSLLIISGCSIATYDKPDYDRFPDSRRGQTKRYYMKQKIWTLGEKFIIKDEFSRPVFYVAGKPFSFGDKLKFFDREGNELAYIKQKVLSLKNLYKIYMNDRLTAKVKKRIRFFRDKFVVDVIGKDDYIVRGNFYNYRYTFTRNGRQVAVVSKKLFSFSDRYRVEIVPGEDDVVILAVAVVIDMINHKEEHHHHISRNY